MRQYVCIILNFRCTQFKTLLLLLHPFNGLFPRTTWLSWTQKGKPFWILLEHEMMGWQWHQLNHMQIISTSLQTDNHASTSPLSFYRPDALPAAQPTAPALKAILHCTQFKAQDKIMQLYITYLHFNGSFPGEPGSAGSSLGFRSPLVPKENQCGFVAQAFYKSVVFPVTQPTVSKH